MRALRFLKKQIIRLGVVSVAILAPSLGGATQHWAQSLFLALIAVLILITPPKWEGVPLAISGGGLLAIAASSFLPAIWFALPDWRRAALNADILLPSTLTPQPWISSDAILLLLGGLLWLAWLLGQTWSVSERRLLARCFCAGALFLGILAIVAFYRQLQIPLWLHADRRFGPFPNRNQSANFFALSAILAFALAHEAFQRRSRWATAWGMCACVLLWALILSFSRAGIGIFFLGLLLWVGLLSLSKRQGRSSARSSASRLRRYKRVALGLGFVLALLTGFLLFGGTTLDRFVSTSSADFRWLIWRDAASMVAASPWLGSGLGNFDSLFPFFRNASIQQQRVIHPESDWLWLAAEMGIPALLLVFGGLTALLRRAWPLEPGTARSLRAACAAGSAAFIAHGFVDVSAHRLGTVLPALFMLALALNPPARARADGAAGLHGIFFRILALLLLVGAWARLHRTAELPAAKNPEAAISRATLVLREAPLDWAAYYERGTARATSRQWINALADFRRANLLEPNILRVPMEEGYLWLAINPPLAPQAWKDALRRTPPEHRAEVLDEILGSLGRFPDLLPRVEALTQGDLNLELAFLPHTPPPRMDEQLARFLPLANGFSPVNRKLLLLTAARRKAELSEFEEAYLLAQKVIEPPALPSIKPAADALREFTLDPGNFAAGFALYSAQIRDGQLADALLTVEKASREPNAPKYLHFLAAELNAKLERWEKAWAELKSFGQL